MKDLDAMTLGNVCGGNWGGCSVQNTTNEPLTVQKTAWKGPTFARTGTPTTIGAGQTGSVASGDFISTQGGGSQHHTCKGEGFATTTREDPMFNRKSTSLVPVSLL